MKRSEKILIGLVLCLWAGFLLHIRDKAEFAVWVLVAIPVLVAGAYWRPADRRRLLITAMLFPALIVIITTGLVLLTKFSARRIDGRLSEMDRGTSESLFHWFHHHPVLAIPLFIVYMALPVFIAFSLVIGEWKPIVRTLLASAVIGPFLYGLFPAVGPGFVQDPAAPPNCVPSLHLTWAMLCTTFLPARWKWAGGLFVLLTAASTISTGEHYLTDLLAAIPYSALFIAIERLHSRQREIRCAESVPVTGD